MMPGGLPSAARRYVDRGGGDPQAQRHKDADNDDDPRLARQALPVELMPVTVAVSAALFFQAASPFRPGKGWQIPAGS